MASGKLGLGLTAAKKILQTLRSKPMVGPKPYSPYEAGAAARRMRTAEKNAGRAAQGKVDGSPVSRIMSAYGSRPIASTLATGAAAVPTFLLGKGLVSGMTTPSEDLTPYSDYTTAPSSDLQKRIDVITEAYSQSPELIGAVQGGAAKAGYDANQMYANMGYPEIGKQYQAEQAGLAQRMLLQNQLANQQKVAESVANLKLSALDNPVQKPLLTNELITTAGTGWDAAGEDGQKAWAQANGYSNLADARVAYIREQLGLPAQQG